MVHTCNPSTLGSCSKIPKIQILAENLARFSLKWKSSWGCSSLWRPWFRSSVPKIIIIEEEQEEKKRGEGGKRKGRKGEEGRNVEGGTEEEETIVTLDFKLDFTENDFKLYFELFFPWVLLVPVRDCKLHVLPLPKTQILTSKLSSKTTSGTLSIWRLITSEFNLLVPQLSVGTVYIFATILKSLIDSSFTFLHSQKVSCLSYENFLVFVSPNLQTP